MRKQRMKKLLSAAMIAIMVFSLSGVTALAEENVEVTQETAEVVESENAAVTENVTEATGENDDAVVEEPASNTGDSAAVTTETEKKTDGAADAQATSLDEAAQAGADAQAAELETQATSELITYTGHQQTYGDLEPVSDGAVMGHIGESKRLEGITITKGAGLAEVKGSIMYRAHVQTFGDQDWVSDGNLAGTTGLSKRVEGIQMYLTEDLAAQYDIYYRVHIQTYGWLVWAKGGTDEASAEWAGSRGLSKRLEAMQIVLVKKDEQGNTSAPALDPAAANDHAFITANTGTVIYSGHQQTYGNLASTKDGAALGVTGESKRLEAFTITKGSDIEGVNGHIMYRVHGQTYGDQEWKQDGDLAGTEGMAKRVEAIQMYLTEDLANQYDIYYRVHIQSFGWMAWAKGGTDEASAEWSGSKGLAKRMEAIQIVMVAKDGNGQTSVPSSNPANMTDRTVVYATDAGSVLYSGTQAWTGELGEVSNGATLGLTGQARSLEQIEISLDGSSPWAGGIDYQTYVQSHGWVDGASNGGRTGVEGKRLEAIRMSLSGDIANYCDIYYRAHVQSYGWLGWAKNGQTAGTEGIAYRMEAIEICIVLKHAPAPGANADYYKDQVKDPVKAHMNALCQDVVNQAGNGLYDVFAWTVNNIGYRGTPDPDRDGYTTCQYYAAYGMENGVGDCYVYAATFCELAKYLGYDAHFVQGYVPRAGGGLITHGWVEIIMGGSTYVFDPDFQYETGRNGYQITYGTSGTWRYTSYDWVD